MLFPVQTVTDLDSVITDSESECDKHVALMKVKYANGYTFQQLDNYK